MRLYTNGVRHVEGVDVNKDLKDIEFELLPKNLKTFTGVHYGSSFAGLEHVAVLADPA